MKNLFTFLKKHWVLLPVLITTALSSSMSLAQTACNGKTLYSKVIVAGQLTCSNGACHGPSPAANQNKLRNGSNNGPAISAAVSNVAEMRFLAGKLTTTEFADLGAYIASPTVTCTTGAPAATLSAATLSFPSTNVGSVAATQTATLTNSGTAALVIASTTLSGADFAISSNTCTAGFSIAAGSSCSVTAGFTPTAAGARSGSITISHNATPATSAISLSGTGVAIVVTAPAANLSVQSLTFASTNVGSTSPAQSVTLSNTGTAPLVLGTTSVTGNFAVASNTCTNGASIAVGGSCSLSIAFSPASIGALYGALTIAHNATPTSSGASLSGTGVAVVVGTPTASLSTSALSFGSTNVGATTSAQSITVTNSGTAALMLGTTSVSGAEFTVTSNTCTSGASIAPAGSCTVSVNFTPSAAGTRSGSLTINHNASAATSTVSLSGTGVAVVIGAPAASLSGAALSFASTTVGTTAAAQSITLTNTGTVALVLGATSVTGADFSIASNTCTSGASIAPAGSCTISVNFTPSAAGARSGSLTINHNASPATSTVSLSGTGVAVVVGAPAASLSSSALSFASTTVGASAAVQTVTLTNIGTAALLLGSTTASNPEFSIASNTCVSGTSVAPGASCTLGIGFSPAAVGARTGTVTVNHNATPAISTLSLAGTGAVVVVTAPAATLSSAALTFASANVGATAASQTVTLTNSGTAPLVLGAASVSGTEFNIASSTCTAGSSMAPSASCAIAVSFTPSAAGIRSGSLTINHNASPATSVVSLSGTGVVVTVGSPAASLSTSALTFGSTTIGTTASAQNIALTNTGTVPLLVGSTVIAGSEFAISTNTCAPGLSLAAGGTCTIAVSFTPSAAGARSGSIAINHNATPTTSSVSLAGTGAAVVVGAPVATPSSTVVTFANATVGTWAPSQTVTLTNTGTSPLNIAALSVSNAEFVASVNSCSAGVSVAPGGNCVITVQFKPAAAGMRLATITLAHNASPAVTTIALSGLGVPPANAAPIVDINSAALILPSTPVGSASPGVSVTLTNTGNAPLVLSDFLVMGDPISLPSEFSIAATNCKVGMTLQASAHCTLIINFAPTSVGSKKATLAFSHNASSGLTSISLTSVATPAATTVPPTRTMIEYRYAPLNYYFITSRDAEKSALDALPDFQRTGESFLVYGSQQGSMRGISRFYFDEVRAGLHSSHFYTLLDEDLVLLADQNPTRSTAPNMAQNEGVDSFAVAPLVSGLGGRCATGLLPVYRVFRGNVRFPNDPNHRFTTSLSVYNSAVAAGWDGEGVNFCVPAQ